MLVLHTRRQEMQYTTCIDSSKFLIFRPGRCPNLAELTDIVTKEFPDVPSDEVRIYPSLTNNLVVEGSKPQR